MKRNRGEVHFEQGQILCDEGIDTGFVKLTDHLFGFAQFIVVENGVERDVDAGAIQMGKIANVAYVFDRVAGCGTRPEGGASYIYGIRAATNGFESGFRIFGGTKQFYGSHWRVFFACLMRLYAR